MDTVGTLINLISGLIGGNVLGSAWEQKSLGSIGNSIAGLIGGGVGSYLLQAINIISSLGLGNMSLSSLTSNIGTSAVSGAILTAIVGLIKGAANKPSQQ
jgi:uncharacterized membrane protein YeaQ/YmgE (transglycosylase-associated protein family)